MDYGVASVSTCSVSLYIYILPPFSFVVAI